jgi:hypothetical protein
MNPPRKTGKSKRDAPAATQQSGVEGDGNEASPSPSHKKVARGGGGGVGGSGNSNSTTTGGGGGATPEDQMGAWSTFEAAAAPSLLASGGDAAVVDADAALRGELHGEGL